MVSKGVAAAGIAAAVGGVALGAFLVQKYIHPPSQPPSSGTSTSKCGGQGASTANCAGGPVGIATVQMLPNPMPSSPSWTPVVGCTYNVCPTANYAAGVTASMSAVGVVSVSPRNNPSSSATWALTYDSATGDWLALTANPSGGIWVFVMYPASYPTAPPLPPST